MDDDMSGDSNRAIWAPHSRGMVGLSDYLDPADDGMHKGQGRHSHGIQQPHRTPPLPQQMPHSRDPSNYYNEDFDNVAYSTANTLLKEDNNLGIARSIWNDRGMLLELCCYFINSIPLSSTPCFFVLMLSSSL